MPVDCLRVVGLCALVLVGTASPASTIEESTLTSSPKKKHRGQARTLKSGGRGMRQNSSHHQPPPVVNGPRTMTDVIVVVDPFSSGKYLIQELRYRNQTLVGVQSLRELPMFAGAIVPDRKALQEGRLAESRFAAIFDHADSKIPPRQDDDTSDKMSWKKMKIAYEPEKRFPDSTLDVNDENYIIPEAHLTLDRIRSAGYNPTAVVAGSEPGCYLTEQLQAALGVPSNRRNSVRTSSLRRNKEHMQEALAHAKLRSIKQKKVNSAEEVIAWMHEENMHFPIIVKPLDSAGTDGVHKCNSDADIENAFLQECGGKLNTCGKTNSDLLAQEFLKGTEYVVDSITSARSSPDEEGKHTVIAMFVYHKYRDLTYIDTELIDSKGPIADKLKAYVAKALDAVGIQYGPSHAEVMMVNDEEPCLIEVGARMHGGGGPNTMKQGTGVSIYEAVADLAMYGELQTPPFPTDPTTYQYQRIAYAYSVDINNRPSWNISGTAVEELGTWLPGLGADPRLTIEESLARLNSVLHVPDVVQNYKCNVPVGMPIKPTVDLLSSPGSFRVIHASDKVCKCVMDYFYSILPLMLKHAIGIDVSQEEESLPTPTQCAFN